MNTKQFLYIKYFYLKLNKTDRIPPNNLRKFIKLLLKFECGNIYFREYFLGVKMEKLYKKMSDRSFFSNDRRVILDIVVIGIIAPNKDDNKN